MQTLNESEAIQIASGTLAEGMGNGMWAGVKLWWDTLLNIPIVGDILFVIGDILLGIGDLILFIWDNRIWTFPLICLLAIIWYIIWYWYRKNHPKF